MCPRRRAGATDRQNSASGEQPDQQRPVRVARASTAGAGLPGERRGPQVPTVAATVNTKRIERIALAAECLHRYGKEVLESMVNKQLIVEECQRRGITVTREEVNAEIDRLARKFRIPVDQWLKMLKQERNVTPRQYADDIIWPMLALRKLAGPRLNVTRAELVREYETQYGMAVRVRLIAVGSPEKAKTLRAQAAANPNNFGNLAKNYSEDPSASSKGLIPPIRQHGSYQEIEDAVFHLADGEISPVIHVADQYLVLKREGIVPARPVSLDAAARELEERAARTQDAHGGPGHFPRLARPHEAGRRAGTIRPNGSGCRAWPRSSTAYRSGWATWPRNVSPGMAPRRSKC